MLRAIFNVRNSHLKVQSDDLGPSLNVMKLRFLLIFTFSYAVVQTGHADGAQGESTVPSVVGYPFTWK